MVAVINNNLTTWLGRHSLTTTFGRMVSKQTTQAHDENINNHHHQPPDQCGPLNSPKGDRWLPRAHEAGQMLVAKWRYNQMECLSSSERLGVISMKDGRVQTHSEIALTAK